MYNDIVFMTVLFLLFPLTARPPQPSVVFEVDEIRPDNTWYLLIISIISCTSVFKDLLTLGFAPLCMCCVYVHIFFIIHTNSTGT